MNLLNCLTLAALVTAIGVTGVIIRRNMAQVVVSYGVALCGLWLALAGAGRFLHPGNVPAMLITLSLAAAGAFAAVGFAVSAFAAKHLKTVYTDSMDNSK